MEKQTDINKNRKLEAMGNITPTMKHNGDNESQSDLPG